jgi:hypothetical protein
MSWRTPDKVLQSSSVSGGACNTLSVKYQYVNSRRGIAIAGPMSIMPCEFKILHTNNPFEDRSLFSRAPWENVRKYGMAGGVTI